jgi:hypothetical protein
MNALIALVVVVAGVGLGLLIAWSVPRTNRKHDPVEYYRGWGGYGHPIVLQNRITKEEADAAAASGYAYVIGYFDAGGKLTRVVKMLRGAVFFDFAYAYHPNGKLMSAKVTNADGVVTVRDYDESGRWRSGARSFW